MEEKSKKNVFKPSLSSIDLFGEKYKIRYVDNIPSDDGYVYGQYNRVKGLIEVALLDDEGKPLSKETVRISLLHEIMHAIFSAGQYREQNDNEPLVEWCAKCLNQLIKSNIL